MITDLTYLKSLANNDETFIRDMINIFREQFEEFMAEMPRLLEESNYDSLSRLAHKAKSSVAVMGMENEAGLLQKLELLAKKGEQTESYSEIIQIFLDKTRLAIEELETAYP